MRCYLHWGIWCFHETTAKVQLIIRRVWWERGHIECMDLFVPLSLDLTQHPRWNVCGICMIYLWYLSGKDPMESVCEREAQHMLLGKLSYSSGPIRLDSVRHLASCQHPVASSYALLSLYCKGSWLGCRIKREIRTNWKHFLLEVGKVDELEFRVEIWSIQLPCY